jgi:uncharacterized protein
VHEQPMSIGQDTTADTPAGPDAVFFRHLERGDLLIQRCGACGRHVFYPRVLCPHCGGSQLGWVPASGHGVVHACSVVMGKPGAGSDYAVALVDLNEGVRMMGRIEACPPDGVHIGMRVRACIAEKDGKPLVRFVPEGGAESPGGPATEGTAWA